jgi:hypothetical protein
LPSRAITISRLVGAREIVLDRAQSLQRAEQRAPLDGRDDQRPDEATALARALIAAVGLPARAAADALHISVAACHGIDYLLTWNSTHIANAEFRPKIEQACRDNGFEPPVLCTPDELMGN